MPDNNVVKLPSTKKKLTAEDADVFRIGEEAIPEDVVKVLIADMTAWLNDPRRDKLKKIAEAKRQLEQQKATSKGPMAKYAQTIIEQRIAEMESDPELGLVES